MAPKRAREAAAAAGQAKRGVGGVEILSLANYRLLMRQPAVAAAAAVPKPAPVEWTVVRAIRFGATTFASQHPQCPNLWVHHDHVRATLSLRMVLQGLVWIVDAQVVKSDSDGGEQRVELAQCTLKQRLVVGDAWVALPNGSRLGIYLPPPNEHVPVAITTS